MNDELRDLLCRYVDNNKFADFEYVNEVINIFIKRYGRHGLKKVVSIEEEQSGISNFDNYTIGINLNYIKSELIKSSWYDDLKSNLYLFNILVILILKHEFNHFRQVTRYRCVINSNDFLDKLFINSFVMTCFSSIELVNSYNDTEDIVLNEIYRKYHDCFSVERLAQIDAYRNIIDLMVPIREKLKQVYYYYLYEYYFYKIKDYSIMDDIVLSPIDKILFLMDDYFQYSDNQILTDDADGLDDDFYENIIDDYSVNERFIYGLPISIAEYSDTVDFVKVMYMLAGNFDIDSNVKKKKRIY